MKKQQYSIDRKKNTEKAISHQEDETLSEAQSAENDPPQKIMEGGVTPSNILGLQRTIGNKAVMRLMATHQPQTNGVIQRGGQNMGYDRGVEGDLYYKYQIRITEKQAAAFKKKKIGAEAIMMHLKGDNSIENLVSVAENDLVKEISDFHELADTQDWNGNIPPIDHQVVDAHIPVGKHRHALGGLIKCNGAAQYFGTPKSAGLVKLMYQVGPWTVFVAWPKGWKAPAPNRYGFLPKCEFGTGMDADINPNLDGQYSFTYKAMDGSDFTPPQPFIPAKN